ncbi:hypothetical protein LWI29_031016 [Acer saccharum]|uniref:Uncharacterized protein n=1 Tax=Acer saccharum TaxID=4024 RepID=A0AA39VAG8_ACESA|nr:hypothetical protein LWI29_031016 [Acer saccharum]
MIIPHKFLHKKDVVPNAPTSHKSRLRRADNIWETRLNPIGNDLSNDFIESVATRDRSKVFHLRRFRDFRDQSKNRSIEFLEKMTRPKELLDSVNHVFTNNVPSFLEKMSVEAIGTRGLVRTLPSLSPQGLQEANAHLQQLMKIMGGAFQVPPLVYRTPRSQAILAPYGVQIEDPPRQEKINKGKAVAEERNRSQSWSGHSDEDSSRSTRTKRKD